MKTKTKSILWFSSSSPSPSPNPSSKLDPHSSCQLGILLLWYSKILFSNHHEQRCNWKGSPDSWLPGLGIDWSLGIFRLWSHPLPHRRSTIHEERETKKVNKNKKQKTKNKKQSIITRTQRCCYEEKNIAKLDLPRCQKGHWRRNEITSTHFHD